MQIPFVGPSNKARSVNVDAQRTVNWYPEINGLGERSEMVLYPRPGLKLFTATGDAEVRGGEVFPVSGGDLYTVTGSELKKVTTAGAVSSIGTLSTTDGLVSMAAGRDQLVIVDGPNGYTYDGTTFARITDADFPGGTHVVWFDGYCVVNNQTTASNDQFHISSIDDATTWNALDFATAEKKPDKLMAHVDRYRELWFIGAESSEVWYNSGNADFPLQPIQAAFSEWGTVAAFSVTRADNAILWLSRNKDGQAMVVMVAMGWTPQRVSTHAVEEAIQGYATISDARAYTFQQRGHTFYVINFPSVPATWVFDLATNLWHEWATLDGSQFRGQVHAFFNGKQYVGDFQDGNILELDLNTYTDNGKKFPCIRESQFIHAEKRRLFHRALEVDFEHGVGNADATDPQVMLQWSDDGGRTWSNEYWRKIGKIGEYDARAIWRQLGSARERTYRIMVTDPVKRVLIGAYLQADAGTRPLT